MVVQDFTFICGGKRVPGTYYMMYMISKCDVATFPALKTSSGIGDKITLNGDIVLKAGKTFAQIAIISDTGKISHSAVGVRSGKSFNNLLDFKLPKTIAADEWFDQHINFEGIVLIREKLGKYRVFGSLNSPAHFETAIGDSGTKNEDANEWIAQLMDEVGNVAPVYEGVITTDIVLGDFNNDFNNDFN